MAEITNQYNPLEGKLDKVIEYFVEFFGEENREKIVERFKDVKYIFKDDHDTIAESYAEKIDYSLRHVFKKCKKELGLKLNDLGFGDFEDLDKWKDNIDLNGYYQTEIYQFAYYGFGIKPENLAEFLKNDNNFKDFSQKIGKIDEIYKKYRDETRKINEERERLCVAPWKSEIDLIESSFYSRWKEKISEKILKEYNLTKTDENLVNLKKVTANVIEYIQTGDVVSEYLISENLNNLVGKKVLGGLLVFKIMTEFQKEDHARKELLYNIKNGFADACLDARNVFPETKAKDVEEDLRACVLNKPKGPVGLCFSCFTDKVKRSYVLVGGSSKTTTDDTIVHEMGHAVQTFMFCDEKMEKFKVGISMAKNGLYYKNNDFHGLDEIMNEFFTQKICARMREDGFEICNKKSYASVYHSVFPYLNDFLEENLEDLKECGISEDFNKVYRRFGEDNLVELDNICSRIIEAKKAGELEKLPENEIKAQIEKISQNVRDRALAPEDEYILV